MKDYIYGQGSGDRNVKKSTSFLVVMDRISVTEKKKKKSVIFVIEVKKASTGGAINIEPITNKWPQTESCLTQCRARHWSVKSLLRLVPNGLGSGGKTVAQLVAD